MNRRSSTTPELAVLVLRAGRRDAFARLVHSLQVQTLHPSRCQILVVDGDARPPLKDSLPADLEHLVEWVDGESRAEALQRAVQRCEAHVVLLLTSDCLAPDELLAQHLVAHEKVVRPGLVQGRVRLAHHRTTLVTELLDRADLIVPGHQARSGPAYALNASLGRDQLQDWVESWQEGGEVLEDRLPGRLLERTGALLRAPEAECLVDRDMDLGTCLKRLQWLGHDLACGQVPWPLPFGDELPRGTQGSRNLRQRLLETEQRCQKARQLLHRLEQEVDPVMRDRWDLRASYLNRIVEEAEPLLQELAVQEVRRGILLGSNGQEPGGSQQIPGSGRLAVCLHLKRAEEEALVRRALDRLPEDVELVVFVDPSAADCRLPRDSRLVRVTCAVGEPARLREHSQASFLACLQGEQVPERAQWEVLQECLRQTPGVVALHVGAGQTVAVEEPKGVTGSEDFLILASERWQDGMERHSSADLCRALDGEILEMELPTT